MKNIINQEEKDRIDQVCKKYKITNYSINSDGSIDVGGDVDFNWTKLELLPLKFNYVSGNFESISCGLTSLVGSPRVINGGFNIFGNEITSLLGCPSVIGGHFHCRSNILTSLEGIPKEVGGFNCTHNKLTSLEFCPIDIKDRFECERNSLPQVMSDFFTYNSSTMEEQKVFIKYQRYYGVWTPEFNIDGFNELVAQIRDGLL
jgi:hypothetical protein